MDREGERGGGGVVVVEQPLTLSAAQANLPKRPNHNCDKSPCQRNTTTTGGNHTPTW